MRKCKQCGKTLLKRLAGHGYGKSQESNHNFSRRMFCDWVCFRKYQFNHASLPTGHGWRKKVEA